MSKMKIHEDICYEGVPKVIMSHVVGVAATAITQAVITAVTYIVDQYASRDDAMADANATSVTAETSAGSVSSLVYDSLQTNNDWEADSSGYNFKFTVPAASFPTGGKWYRVEVWMDPVSGEDFLAGVWVFECLATARD